MTYKVLATRDEAGFWNAVVPDVPGAFTFARRLDLLEPRVAEAIAVMLDLDDASGIAVDIVPQLPSEVDRELSRARHLRAQAEDVSREASEASRRAARRLVEDEHLTVRDAGALLGLSPQRVQQLVKGEPNGDKRRRSQLGGLPHMERSRGAGTRPGPQ